jgi:hypothetical protein
MLCEDRVEYGMSTGIGVEYCEKTGVEYFGRIGGILKGLGRI